MNNHQLYIETGSHGFIKTNYKNIEIDSEKFFIRSKGREIEKTHNTLKIHYDEFYYLILYSSWDIKLLYFLRDMIIFEVESDIKLNRNKTFISREDLKLYEKEFYKEK